MKKPISPEAIRCAQNGHTAAHQALDALYNDQDSMAVQRAKGNLQRAIAALAEALARL